MPALSKMDQILNAADKAADALARMGEAKEALVQNPAGTGTRGMKARKNAQARLRRAQEALTRLDRLARAELARRG